MTIKLLVELTLLFMFGFVMYIALKSLHLERDVHQMITRRHVTPSDAMPPDDQTEEHYQHAAVATDSPECSLVGKDVLQNGGSAVDAAISAMLCLGVINSHSTGLGGGGFMLVYTKANQKTEAIDYREVAPKEASANMFGGDPNKAALGGLAVAVPGELRGMEAAWKLHGQLPWRELFQPAIKIATEGFKMTETLSIAVNKYKEDISKDRVMRNYYLLNGTTMPVNRTMKNLPLAKTLTEIASAGNADPFYVGKFASTIAQDIKEHGGIVTLEDLKDYKVVIRKAIETDLGQYKLLNFPAPTSGPILALILNILKGYNFTADDLKNDPTLVYHRFVEAFKFAYSYKPLMSDPDYEASVRQLVRRIVKDSTANEIRAKINDTRTMEPSYYGGYFNLNLKTATSHLVVVAPNGDAVSMTSTINDLLGAKFRSETLGFTYNDQMDDFDFHSEPNLYGLPVSEVNSIRPGKKPQSYSAPVIILDKQSNVKLVAGSSGASTIATALGQMISLYLWFGFSLKEAVESPRLHHQLIPNTVYVEERFNKTIAEILRSKYHHRVAREDEYHAVIQACARDIKEHKTIINQTATSEDTELFAVSDFRKGGRPAGF